MTKKNADTNQQSQEEKQKAEERKARYVSVRMRPGTLVWTTKNNEAEQKARYSKVYKPAGLRFTRNFHVVTLSYWIKYRLINGNDVNLYNLLHVLADKDMAFTIRGLAYHLEKHHTLIRKSLDRLENVNLIHTLKLADVQGQPNYYVICTPLFESPDSLTGSVRDDLQKAGEPMPTIFLITKLEEFSKRLKLNITKDRRDNPANYPNEDQRKKWWKELLREFAGDWKQAISFDNAVADIVSQYGSNQPLDAFERVLKAKLDKEGLKLTPRWKKVAHEQRAFYDLYQQPKSIWNADEPEEHCSELPTIPDEALYVMRSMIADGRGFQAIRKQFEGSFSADQWAEIEKLLATA